MGAQPMIDEAKVEELLGVLRQIDVEKDEAKADAKRHKERIDELLEYATTLRHKLEGKGGPTLFDEPEGDDEGDDDEPQRMTALDSTTDGALDSLGDRAYEAGAQARMDGKPESDCPHEADSFIGRSWINGWRDAEDLEEEGEDAEGPVL